MSKRSLIKQLSLLAAGLILCACQGQSQGTKTSTAPASSSQKVTARSTSKKASASSTSSQSKTETSATKTTTSQASNTSTKASQSEASKASETTKSSSSGLYIAPDSPVTKPIVAMPKELVGTWSYEDDHQMSTITIASDGSVSRLTEYKQAEHTHEYQGNIAQVIQESKTLFRVQTGQDGVALIPITGLGGVSKGAIGFELDSQGLLIYNWSVRLEEDLEKHDFANDKSMVFPLKRAE